MSRFLMVCSGFLLACSLQAGTVLYDSTGQTPTGFDPIQSFGPLYDSFSTGANSGSLSNLEFVLSTGANTDLESMLSGDGTSASISVDLYADSGSSTVGGFLANLGTIDDSSLPSSLTLIDLTLVSNPYLDSGTRYWIGLTGSGNTTGIWSYTTDTSGIGVNGEYFQNSVGTAPNNPDGGYQMEVEVGATPEPSTLLLGASTLLALALLRRRLASK